MGKSEGTEVHGKVCGGGNRQAAVIGSRGDKSQGQGVAALQTGLIRPLGAETVADPGLGQYQRRTGLIGLDFAAKAPNMSAKDLEIIFTFRAPNLGQYPGRSKDSAAMLSKQGQ